MSEEQGNLPDPEQGVSWLRDEVRKKIAVCLNVGRIAGLIIAICMLVIGTIYIDSCPDEKMIPLLLLLGGILVMLLFAVEWVKNSDYVKNRDIERVSSRCLFYIIYSLFISWWMTDSTYVYRTDFSNLDDIDCNPTLYSFSFWLLNIFNIFVGIIFLIVFCGLCVFCIGVCAVHFKSKRTNENLEAI